MDGPGDTAFTATPAQAALPAGWLARDIGSVGGTGATGVAGGGAAATYTLVSSGADIWGAADAFRYAYQTLVGDGTITARVSAQEDTGGWAKAGVMVRETLAAGSKHAMMMVTPGNGTALQYRSGTGGQSTNGFNTPGAKAPYWVRLRRAGNTLTASYSSDGTNWTVQGTVNITMQRSVFVGLAATAADNANLATVTFNNVTLTNDAPTVAAVAAASPETVTGVSTALSVLGADDHGEPLLTYTWSATSLPEGAAVPTFGDNGTNAAKAVTATFTKAGTYTFRVRIADVAGLSALSDVTVVVEPTLTRLALTPAGPAPVAPGQSLQFTAAEVDQFGDPIEGAAPQVLWVSTGGSITQDGWFTAPAETGTYTITALAGGADGSAEVTVAVVDATAPLILAAASRKTHGSRGAFDLPLSRSAEGAAATVEPRIGGPTTLRFTFSEPVAAEDGALDAGEFLIANADFGSAVFDATGTVLTLTLTGVRDRSVVSVLMAGIADPSGNTLVGDVDVSIRALAGDVNGNGVVNAIDLLMVRRSLFRPAGAESFLADLDADGSIDSVDLVHARRNDGHGIL
jgi:regulation of enolase protein 1 (concanavalin A-like superfamily)